VPTAAPWGLPLRFHPCRFASQDMAGQSTRLQSMGRHGRAGPSTFDQVQQKVKNTVIPSPEAVRPQAPNTEPSARDDGDGRAGATRPHPREASPWRGWPNPDAGDADEPARFARSLARKHRGMPPAFTAAFASQAVSLRDMGEAALRRAVAERILSAWLAFRAEGRGGVEALVSRMGLQGQRALLAILPALPAERDEDAAVAALAGALSLAGIPLAGMPGEVRDRYAAVLDGAGRIDPAWGLLQAWLVQVPADPG
jgi:hypothetical protein